MSATREVLPMSATKREDIPTRAKREGIP